MNFDSVHSPNKYNRSDLFSDIYAGIIVAIMIIPQGMAYAILAGLDPVIGLYSSTIPIFIYALFGSSKHLSVGPISIVSLLIITGLSTIAQPGTTEYVQYVITLSFIVGIINLLLGFFRIGNFSNYLSDAAVNGFISSVAIIIVLTQIKNLFGISLENNYYGLQLVSVLFYKISEVNILTFILGGWSIVLLIYFKTKLPRFPISIFIVIFSIVLVSSLNLHSAGVDVVGHIPAGFPPFQLPNLGIDIIKQLFLIALTISFVGSMESIAVAKTFAQKDKYNINPNQELKSLGLANIVGSFFSSMPITGAISRTAVNYISGAKTTLASIITAFLVLIILLFFTHYFYYLPKSVLAAIIIVAVYKLIAFKKFIFFVKNKKIDAILMIVVFSTTFLISVVTGIVLAIVLSLLDYIVKNN
jgi:SulP family sulfate permease